MERSIAGSVVSFTLGFWPGHWYVISWSGKRAVNMLTFIAYQSNAAAIPNWYLLLQLQTAEFGADYLQENTLVSISLCGKLNSTY